MSGFYVLVNATSNGVANQQTIRTGPGRVLNIAITNTSAAARTIMMFDAAATPSDGATSCIWSYTLAAGASYNTPLGTFGLAFTNGLVVVNSATAASKTLATADATWQLVIS